MPCADALQVTPEKNRALIISIHTLFVTLSNSLLPLLGVQLYRMFGSDAHGMLLMNLTLAAYRIAVTILLICRFRRLKRAGNLFRPLA